MVYRMHKLAAQEHGAPYDTTMQLTVNREKRVWQYFDWAFFRDVCV